MGDKSLVVSFLLDPTAGAQAAKEVLPAFVITEDEEREGKGRQPPGEFQWVHPKALIHARSVRKECGERGLKAEPEVHHPIAHTLLEHRVLPSLANDEISPLYNDN